MKNLFLIFLTTLFANLAWAGAGAICADMSAQGDNYNANICIEKVKGSAFDENALAVCKTMSKNIDPTFSCPTCHDFYNVNNCLESIANKSFDAGLIKICQSMVQSPYNNYETINCLNNL